VADLRSTFSGSIPEYYDACLGPAWFEPFAGDLAQRLPVQPPGDVLEIACGTGRVTRHVRARLEPSVRLVATDLSKAMIDFARSKQRGNIEWREADATRLPFADGEFGAALCSFGVMFVSDRRAAFREVRRVLKAGGILLFNVWDRIEENPHALVNAELIEGLYPGDPEVRFRMPYEMHDTATLESMVRDSGFRPIRIERKRFDVTGVSARNIALGQIRGTPRSLLLEKRGASLEHVIDQLAVALAQQGGDPYRGQAQAIVVEAEAL
jgi:SAM-dependent methyltransferase